MTTPPDSAFVRRPRTSQRCSSAGGRGARVSWLGPGFLRIAPDIDGRSGSMTDATDPHMDLPALRNRLCPVIGFGFTHYGCKSEPNNSFGAHIDLLLHASGPPAVRALWTMRHLPQPRSSIEMHPRMIAREAWRCFTLLSAEHFLVHLVDALDLWVPRARVLSFPSWFRKGSGCASGGMADALASGASARIGRGGSTPLSRTSQNPVLLRTTPSESGFLRIGTSPGVARDRPKSRVVGPKPAPESLGFTEASRYPGVSLVGVRPD